MTPRVRVVGRGRAGGSFEGALRAAGWAVELIAHDDDRLPDAARDVDLVLLCVPDGAIAPVAARIDAHETTVVAHCAGSRTLEELAAHPRRASVHPLVSMPDPVRGARRLIGAWFAVAGDPLVGEVVRALRGTAVEVPDDRRVEYHAAAVIASNHLVALMGQVERVATGAGVPLEAFLDLSRGSLENVAEVGPAAALTGPVARGDHETVLAHLSALDPAERLAYRALADAAARLVGVDEPPWPDDATGSAGGAP